VSYTSGCLDRQNSNITVKIVFLIFSKNVLFGIQMGGTQMGVSFLLPPHRIRLRHSPLRPPTLSNSYFFVIVLTPGGLALGALMLPYCRYPYRSLVTSPQARGKTVFATFLIRGPLGGWSRQLPARGPRAAIHRSNLPLLLSLLELETSPEKCASICDTKSSHSLIVNKPDGPRTV